jgi:hypothetical protein
MAVFGPKMPTNRLTNAPNIAKPWPKLKFQKWPKAHLSGQKRPSGAFCAHKLISVLAIWPKSGQRFFKSGHDFFVRNHSISLSVRTSSARLSHRYLPRYKKKESTIYYRTPDIPLPEYGSNQRKNETEQEISCMKLPSHFRLPPFFSTTLRSISSCVIQSSVI